MDRPWKRIIPPTEDSDSWSSGDTDLDMNDLNQQWISINKRARLSAQANMRGENLPLDSGDPDNIQIAIDNVLLHHDYAEQSQRRNSSSMRMHNCAVAPINDSIRMYSGNDRNENENRTPYHDIFQTASGNASSPVHQRSEFDLFEMDLPTPTLSSSVSNSTSAAYESKPRFRSCLPASTFVNSDQASSSTAVANGASSSGEVDICSTASTATNSHIPSHKRQIEALKNMDFLVAMRRYKLRRLSLSCEDANNEAGSSNNTFETSCLTPSSSTSRNTSPIRNIIDILQTKAAHNNATTLPSASANKPETVVNESKPEIIQVPPVESLQSSEAAESISTITVSTSETVNDKDNDQKTIKDNQHNSSENNQTIESPEKIANNSTNAENTNDVKLENRSPDAPQVQISNSETIDVKVNYLNQGLLNILECPVCWEYISPPIHQCKRGHLVCLSCMQRLHSCPTCRSRFTNLRNLAMEKVAGKLLYPCKNSQSGCNETMRLVDKPEHEANCMHRVYRCIVSVCPWNGKHPDLLNHMTHEHHEIVVYGDHKYLYISLDNNAASENWILLAHDVIFRVNFAINSTLGKIHGCVQYVGPRRLANNYSYTFRAESTGGDMQRCVEYTRTTHNDQDKLSAIYNAGDAFMLMRNTAAFFSACTDRHMLVKVTIKKINEIDCDIK